MEADIRQFFLVQTVILTVLSAGKEGGEMKSSSQFLLAASDGTVFMA